MGGDSYPHVSVTRPIRSPILQVLKDGGKERIVQILHIVVQSTKFLGIVLCSSWIWFVGVFFRGTIAINGVITLSWPYKFVIGCFFTLLPYVQFITIFHHHFGEKYVFLELCSKQQWSRSKRLKAKPRRDGTRDFFFWSRVPFHQFIGRFIPSWLHGTGNWPCHMAFQHMSTGHSVGQWTADFSTVCETFSLLVWLGLGCYVLAWILPVTQDIMWLESNLFSQESTERSLFFFSSWYTVVICSWYTLRKNRSCWKDEFPFGSLPIFRSLPINLAFWKCRQSSF